jgi:hypothetical protein
MHCTHHHTEHLCASLAKHKEMFDSQIVAYRVWFESSRWPFHPWIAHVVYGPLFWHQQHFLFFFLSSSSWLLRPNHQIFKQPFKLCCLHIWSMFFLLLFILFKMIYKIDFFLISSFFNVFHLSDLVSVQFKAILRFDCYLFCFEPFS